MYLYSQTVATTAGMRSMFWEETFSGAFGALPASIITPWVHENIAREAVESGHDVINLYSWYLDQWVPPARTDVENYTAMVSYAYIDSWRSE